MMRDASPDAGDEGVHSVTGGVCREGRGEIKLGRVGARLECDENGADAAAVFGTSSRLFREYLEGVPRIRRAD